MQTPLVYEKYNLPKEELIRRYPEWALAQELQGWPDMADTPEKIKVVVKILPTTLKCHKCGHEWQEANPPEKCPKCLSDKWNILSVRVEIEKPETKQ